MSTIIKDYRNLGLNYADQIKIALEKSLDIQTNLGSNEGSSYRPQKNIDKLDDVDSDTDSFAYSESIEEISESEDSENEFSFFEEKRIDEVKILNSVLKNPKTKRSKLFQKCYQKLNSFQKDIFKECIFKSKSGLCLPLGSGKTFLSLMLSLYKTRETGKPILIIVAKSLIANWETEIEKFFGKEIKYEVLHNSRLPKKTGVKMWTLKSSTDIIITTINMLSRIFSRSNMVNKIRQGNTYSIPTGPIVKDRATGGRILFSIEWGMLIVDEIQKYTNVETYFCQSLMSIYSKNRWLLSGTIFDEPKMNRIFGYYLILGNYDCPRTLYQLKKKMNSKDFKGLNSTLVYRKKNLAFVKPKVNEYIVCNELSKEEEIIYTGMKDILVDIKDEAKKAKILKDSFEFRKLNSYKLVIVTYLRQILVCPILPIVSITVDTSDIEEKSELATILSKKIKNLKLKKWLDNEKSIMSTRISKIIEVINKNKNEKVVLFCCFKSCLDIIHYLAEQEIKTRKIFKMTSSMNSKTRGKCLKDFKESENGILLLTYQLGAEGLNLQFASTVLLVDFWWNAAKVQQAIGRIYRYGQKSKAVNIYFFTSNTAIEKIIFEKQRAKLKMLQELQVGNMKTTIPKINIDKVIEMIQLNSNKEKLSEIKYY